MLFMSVTLDVPIPDGLVERTRIGEHLFHVGDVRRVPRRDVEVAIGLVLEELAEVGDRARVPTEISP